MPKFYIHEKMNCEVTFVKVVEAADKDAALEKSWDGGAELLGVSVGDIVAGGYQEDVYIEADNPRLTCWYPEPE